VPGATSKPGEGREECPLYGWSAEECECMRDMRKYECHIPDHEEILTAYLEINPTPQIPSVYVHISPSKIEAHKL